jgi:hypothetical protein
MVFSSDDEASLDKIDEDLRNAIEPTFGLFSKIIAGACTRIPILGRSENRLRIARLTEAGAWTDAAIALLKMEMPGWQIRRLGYENEEWLCSLSRQPNLPMALDDCAEATHETLPLAILRALVEARRMAYVTTEIRSTVPQVRSAPTEHFVCCDNFS